MTLSYISNAFYGGNFNAEYLAILALFHDYPETVKGDIISPIHYNSNVAQGLEKLEEEVMENLVGQIAEPFKEKFSSYINSQKEDEKTLKLLKAADKISALLKCLKERQMGNTAFENVKVDIISCFLTFNEPRLPIGNTNGFVKIENSLITELPYDEIIKKENWDGKWSCIFKNK